jgi:cytochrome c biogenesis protein CcdA
MYIVAIAWIYVVLMMSITETSFVAGIMTFLMYCVLPLTIIFYLTGGSRRKRQREAMAQADALRVQQAKENPSGHE